MKHNFSRSAFVVVLLSLLVTQAARAQSSAELRRQGQQALDAGDFTTARQIFASLVASDASSTNLDYLATAEASGGRFTDAIHHWQLALQKGGASPELRYHLGLAYLQTHQPGEGIRQLKLALASVPADDEVRYTLAVALLDANRASDALPYLRQSRQAKPKDPAVWANIVRAYLMLGDLKKANNAVDAAEDAFPQQPRVAITLADLCLRNHDPQKARDLLESASEAMPEDMQVKLLLARASLAANEPLEVLAVLKDVSTDRVAPPPGKRNLPGAPAPGELTFLRGSALALLNKNDDAERALSSAISADPHNVEFLLARADLYRRRKRYELSLKDLARAREIAPPSPLVVYEMAITTLLSGNQQGAVALCDQAIALSPRFAPAYFVEGLIAMDQNNYESAVSHFSRAIEINPEIPLFQRELGEALVRKGIFRAGESHLEKAIAASPKDAVARYWRARALLALGRPVEALNELKTAVALNDDFAPAYREMGKIYALQGNASKAAIVLSHIPQPQSPSDTSGQESDLRQVLDGLSSGPKD